MPTHPRPRRRSDPQRREYERNRAELKRDNPHGPCARCGGAIDPELSGLHPQGWTADHVTPRDKGGTNETGNLVPMHRRCNISKGAGGRRPSTPDDRSRSW
jgi:5-methylcytosine-specific restriction endonuclease McrA